MYSLIWLVYIAACLVALLSLFWLTSGIKNAVLRWMLRLPFVALCFTPVQVSGIEEFWLAPLMAALAMELVAGNNDAMISYGVPLAAGVALALVCGLLLGLLIQRKQGH